MSGCAQNVPSLGACLLWLRHLLGPMDIARNPEYGSWFERAHNSVFNPGTSQPLAVSLWFEPSSPYGFQALFSKSGEYELILQTGKLVLRVASNTGGGSWDKEVEVSHSITSGWHHALFWIEPGVEIGLCLDGGTPETEGLAAGQAARVINGGVLISYPPPPEPSSSWQWSSSYYYPSSSWAMDADLLSTPSPYQGLVDEIAVFNETLNAGWRAALYGSGWGLFWHADHDDWGPCQWSSSSWHWSSSYYYSSSYPYSSSYYSSWPSSWAMRGQEGSSESGKSVDPVTFGLLALAREGDPDRVLTQYVWGARPGHRDELILRDRATVGSGELDERLYCLMDYFDPTSAVGVDGEVVERYGFSAFGVREVMAADWSPRSESWFNWEFEFHGQFLDGETGYYNYGYRYYVPWLGRWVSRDPIGERGGVNLYGMAGNDVVNGFDYLGLFWPTGSLPFPVPNLRPFPATTPPVKPPAGCSGTINAIQALMAEYENMKNANTIGADQYFHCIGMCKAARESSKKIADILARLREIGDNLKVGVTSCLDAQEMYRIAEDSLTRDMPANQTGINCLEDKSCEECCECYKVNGLK